MMAVVVAIGCRDRSKVNVSEIRPRETESDNLQAALTILDGLDDADLSQSISTCLYTLNQWIEKHDDDPLWVTPSLLNTVPIELSRTGLANLVGVKRFFPPDITYLHEMSWVSGIARWVQTNEVKHREIWDAYIPETLVEQERAQLQSVLRLFDWTVRNIQLDPLLEYPSVPEGESKTAVQLGLPGPGYTMSVGDLLVFGHGDWWQRARLLALLARQVDIQIVLLGLPAEFGEERVPWLTACLVGDQLYLLDIEDGLPVLNEAGSAIVTLSELRDNPAFAATLLPADLQATVESTLQGLIGLIEADAMSISHRMAILEKYFTGDRQMKLTMSPNTLSRALRTKHGIEKSEIWVPAYEYHSFASALKQRLKLRDPQALAFNRNQHDYQLLEDMLQLKQGRFKALRGQFEDFEIEVGQETQRGSKTLLMASRIPQDQIVKMTTDPLVQQELGYVRPDGMSFADWQENLRKTKQTFVRAKDMASYLIGMIHMEQGNYSDAIGWLEQRTLQIGVPEQQETEPPATITGNQTVPAERPSLDLLPGLVVGHPVTPDVNRLEKSAYDVSARYNLARCYLATGDYQRAKQLLADDAFDASQKRAHAKLLALIAEQE